jgi:hypothetical protein
LANAESLLWNYIVKRVSHLKIVRKILDPHAKEIFRGKIFFWCILVYRLFMANGFFPQHCCGDGAHEIRRKEAVKNVDLKG